MGSDIWINGGYFMLRREILDQLRPRRGPGRGAAAAAGGGGQGAGAAPRGVLGADGHAQGQAAAREPARERRRRRGRCGIPTETARRARRVPPPGDDAAGTRPAERRRRAILAIGAHPDDIEIGCGGTLLQLIEQGAVAEVRWVVLSGDGERATRRAAAPRRCSAACRGTGAASATSATASSPTRAADQGVLRGTQGRVLAGCGLHPPAHRPPPGPPADLRADVEHVPRPPDPRVRGAQVRRRHGRAERLRAAPGAAPRRKIDHLLEHFASQRSKRWFGEDLFSGLLRLRGMECNSPTSYAEAFFCRKAVLA